MFSLYYTILCIQTLEGMKWLILCRLIQTYAVCIFFNSFSKFSRVSPLLQGTTDNYLHSTLHSNTIWLPNVGSQTLGSHIVFECNVECKKLSTVPRRRGQTLKNLEKELKKNKRLSFKFPLWKEIYKWIFFLFFATLNKLN